MGRHRDTGAGTRPELPADGSRSHRRPASVTRDRAAAVVAVGALAGGIAVASTAGPWSPDAAPDPPQARPDGPSGTAGEPGAPVPPPRAPSPPGTVAVPAGAPAPVAEPPAPVAEPPAPVAEPPAPVAEPPAPTLWRADGPAAFRRTPWNTVGPLPPRVDDDEVTVLLTGRGQRSEVEPDVPAAQEGDRHDVTFSVRLDGEFAPGSATRQVIARWENDGPGPAPLDLRVRDGELVLHGGEGHPSGPRTVSHALGPAPIGAWTDLRVRVDFSANPDKARVEVWRDGRLVVDDHPRGGTLYPGQQSYLKVGLHRDRLLARPSSVQFRSWQLEHGRATPVPDRGEASQAPAPERRPTDPPERADRAAPSEASAARTTSASRHDGSARDSTRRVGTADDDGSSTDGSAPTASEDRTPSDGSSTSALRTRSGHERDDGTEPRRAADVDGSPRDRSADDRAERGSSESAESESPESESPESESPESESPESESDRSDGSERDRSDRADRDRHSDGGRSANSDRDSSDSSDSSDSGRSGHDTDDRESSSRSGERG